MPILAPFATTRATNAMVCAADQLAAQAGVYVLRRGGNAVDAAIATNAVMAVVAPHLCGLGGDLFALVHLDPGAPAALNASGRAGSGAAGALEAIRAEGRTVMPFKDDIRSVTIPGCVDGWVALHERFAMLPLDELLEPARRYASAGFAASPVLASASALIAGRPGADDFPAGLRAGDVITRPGVARALGAIGRSGRRGFYEGEFGTGLLALGSGLFSEPDLSASQADWVEPLRIDVCGHRVWTIPPNSQGYLTLGTAWLAEHAGLPDDPADPRWPHLLLEAAKAAGYDRPHVLHDRASGAELLGDDRLRSRLATIDADRALPLAVPSVAGGTTYLCVVDRDGCGVSLIQSNASGFGSHLFEPSTRINLHNRGLGFRVDDHPGACAPGRRPPHTLSPALVTTAEGGLAAVVGTMGGDAQPLVVAQLVLRAFGAGEEAGAAVAAPRVMLTSNTGFDTWTPAAAAASASAAVTATPGVGEPRPTPPTVAVEGHAPSSWPAGLAARGHPVVAAAPFDRGFGHAHLIRVLPSGVLEGAADPRAIVGAAAAY